MYNPHNTAPQRCPDLLAIHRTSPRSVIVHGKSIPFIFTGKPRDLNSKQVCLLQSLLPVCFHSNKIIDNIEHKTDRGIRQLVVH